MCWKFFVLTNLHSILTTEFWSWYVFCLIGFDHFIFFELLTAYFFFLCCFDANDAGSRLLDEIPDQWYFSFCREVTLSIDAVWEFFSNQVKFSSLRIPCLCHIYLFRTLVIWLPRTMSTTLMLDDHFHFVPLGREFYLKVGVVWVVK